MTQKLPGNETKWTGNIWFWDWGPFLEGPDNHSGPKSCFMFVVFAFKIKVSIILQVIQWNYKFMK